MLDAEDIIRPIRSDIEAHKMLKLFKTKELSN